MSNQTKNDTFTDKFCFSNNSHDDKIKHSIFKKKIHNHRNIKKGISNVTQLDYYRKAKRKKMLMKRARSCKKKIYNQKTISFSKRKIQDQCIIDENDDEEHIFANKINNVLLKQLKKQKKNDFRNVISSFVKKKC